MLKKKLAFWGMLVLLVGLALGGLVSCKGNERPIPDTMDFYPIIFRISVSNAQGEDIVDPSHTNTISKEGVKVVMQGKTYELGQDDLKTYMPHFSGLTIWKPVVEGQPWELNFGEFDGAENGAREVTLIWPDGTQNVLKYTNQVTWTRRLEELVDRHFFLDGKQQRKGFYRYHFVKG